MQEFKEETVGSFSEREIQDMHRKFSIVHKKNQKIENEKLARREGRRIYYKFHRLLKNLRPTSEQRKVIAKSLSVVYIDGIIRELRQRVPCGNPKMNDWIIDGYWIEIKKQILKF